MDKNSGLLESDCILWIRGVSAWAGARCILREVDVALVRGEVACLLGPNGGGKTTLMRLIAGLAVPPVYMQGAIRIKSHPAFSGGAPNIGFAVPPEWLAEELTGRAALQLARTTLGLKSIKNALEYAECVGLSEVLDEPISYYSFGTKQKIAMALAFMPPVRLFVLDESLNGLDIASTDSTVEYLRSRVSRDRAAALLVTHRLEIAHRIADTLWTLADGQIKVSRACSQVDSMLVRVPEAETNGKKEENLPTHNVPSSAVNKALVSKSC